MYPHAIIFSAYVLLRRGPLKRLLVHRGPPVLRCPPRGHRAALSPIPMHLYAVLEELRMYRLIHRVSLLLVVVRHRVFLRHLRLVMTTLETGGWQGFDCPPLGEGGDLLVIHLYFI
jgi:hypothetical protein